ncbi:MAG: Kae1-associated serine/threonine protein kinase [Candidatus Micrarchaeota archaeon]|nr:Kae1-associated serine/threonine protein kinase [Candidatus Micrarchaeota archaeon]
MRKLSEGAEAKVFETRVFGVEAVVKLRQKKAYRIMELDETLRRTRTRKEARAMLRTSEAGVSVPRVLGLGKFSIYMEKVSGKLLKDVPGKRVSFANMGAMLAKMHAANVTHGDFTPANVMVSGRRMYIIDFGLSDISNSIEDRAIDLLLMKRSISERQYKELAGSYAKAYAESKRVFSRLADIERRGRYQIRTLA